MYTLSVNFLLYVVLIIVFYMLVRFYLDEETSHNDGGYAKLPTSPEDDDEAENDGEISDTVEKSATRVGSPQKGADGSFLNVNEWGEPDGTKQEVIQEQIEELVKRRDKISNPAEKQAIQAEIMKLFAQYERLKLWAAFHHPVGETPPPLLRK